MTIDPARRRWLRVGCAHCLAWAGGAAWARDDAPLTLPARFARPELASDEGGLWAIMDREEGRLRRSPFLVRDDALQRYLTGVLCKLGGEHCTDTRLYTVRTAAFNATMAPNGMMQLWTGLLLRLDNEAQLAAIVGHELGHYLQRHAVSRQREARSSSALASLMSSFGLVGLFAQYATIAGYLSYTREHEREADRIGITLSQRAGYDTREASKVWAHLRAELSAGRGGDPAHKSVLFASHPGVDERERTLEQLGAGGAGFVGAAEYQARIEPLVWGLLEDELQRAEYEQSLVLLDRLVATRPDRGDLRYFRGEARRLRADDADLDAALADFSAALAATKPPPQAHRSLGLVHRRQGRPEDARAAFARYLEALPAAPDAALVRSYLAELAS
jgi:predicted Zn-dependent protease